MSALNFNKISFILQSNCRDFLFIQFLRLAETLYIYKKKSCPAKIYIGNNTVLYLPNLKTFPKQAK